MITQIIFIVTGIKFLFMPLYRSTDFEVHRNWLAITHNRSIEQWYFDTTSEWTLDYPPFFAWLELGISHVAKFFDPEMLRVENLNYASDMTVLFQRLSVIMLDFFYIYSVKRCSDLLDNGKLLVFVLLVSNPGLIMVDHIHFQYNGFLFGLLLLSVSHMITGNFLKSAFWFAVLLNFKHIFLYIAPVYVVYLMRAYCFTVSSVDGVHTPWNSYSITNFIKLAIIVVTVFGISFGPFIRQLPQLFSRLFPFKRGLCHAYWAPNFWALYNFCDKVLQHLCAAFGIKIPRNVASMTGGLVQEFEHAVLPTIKPNVTFLLTVLSMMPALVKLWHLGADRRYRNMSFVSFLSVLGVDDAKLFLFATTVGHYSLFPLLYERNLTPIKILLLLTHCAVAFSYIPGLYEVPKTKKTRRRDVIIVPMMTCVEMLYFYGLLMLCVYENVIHSLLGLDKTLPFLPLMMTSVYCSLGVFYFWVSYYHYFLTFNVSSVPIFKAPRSMEYQKVK
ncbi:unnamed protein product [Leptidea sinapis]|uniref:Alpha-1,3-glucosyltransferase n=1 Tax=Leptidea sinapis TaxID=189913 RepID=A0A5E4PY86_9NEOP|nr:unnamed protein product [Leptidea sinapis]